MSSERQLEKRHGEPIAVADEHAVPGVPVVDGKRRGTAHAEDEQECGDGATRERAALSARGMRERERRHAGAPDEQPRHPHDHALVEIENE